VNLFKFADILIKRGVVNAINLDGGGSNTLLVEGTLVNYPGDYCHEDKKLYLCPRKSRRPALQKAKGRGDKTRKVSTVLCVHDVANDTDSSSNGDGGGGSTPCVSPWCGEKCELLNCDETDCNGNGVCTNGKKEHDLVSVKQDGMVASVRNGWYNESDGCVCYF
uniref:Phosphodiester glycosidase domain-containing protein n=1 Tax=Amphimedon queenslandica TaxID=400682 RepID=A0A1X7T1V7_AMPQE